MSAFSNFYIGQGDGVPNRPTTWRGTWNTTPSGATGTMWMEGLQTTFGLGSNSGDAIFSASTDTAILRLCSRPLAAQTISGTLDVILGLIEDNAAANLVLKVHAFIRVGQTNTVRHTLLSNFVDTQEWPTTSTGRGFGAGPQTLTAGDAQDGDTLVVEIGFRSTASPIGIYSGTIRRGCMTVFRGLTPQSNLTVGSTNTTTEAGRLFFSNPITFLDTANDAWANATVLTGSIVDSGVSLYSAVREGTEAIPLCSGGSPTGSDDTARYNSVYYTWLCPTNQNCTVTAEITGGVSTFNTVLMVLTGTPGAFVTVDCAAQNDPTTESITFAAVAGTTYTFQVTTELYAGGVLNFTFSPDVEPSNAETTIPMGFFTLTPPDLSNSTAMGWVTLIAPAASVRHFVALGDDSPPLVPGDPVIWVGTDVDGVTLRLDIDDGVTPQTFLGPVLDLDTYYHWIYQKDGDDHRVYLSTDGDTGDPTLVIEETVPVAFPLAQIYAFALAATTIPKGFKVWEAVLPLSQLAPERDTYNAVERTALFNVTKFQTDTADTTGGWTDYSGYDNRAGHPVAGPTEWEIIKGPNLPTLPARPYSDNFESYLAGEYTGFDPFVGVVAPVQNYEYLTSPAQSAWIQASVGINGTQAFTTDQYALQCWFEHDDYDGRCGSLSFFGYKATGAPSSISKQHGPGASIISISAVDSVSGFDFGFFFNNFPLSVGGGTDGSTSIMRVSNRLTGDDYEIADVYLQDQWQFFQLFWELSTVAGSQTDVNADGSLYVVVDGRLVLELTGIRLACTDADWTSDINSWEASGSPGQGLSTICRLGLSAGTVQANLAARAQMGYPTVRNRS